MFFWHPKFKDFYSKWAAAGQNQQYGMGAQLRLRSAWAFRQSDQSSLSIWRNIGPLTTYWAHGEDWSESADAQADLCLRWAHMSFCWFCCAVARVFFVFVHALGNLAISVCFYLLLSHISAFWIIQNELGTVLHKAFRGSFQLSIKKIIKTLNGVVLISFEPTHEILALFVLCKFILQIRMRSHPAGLDVWFLVWPSTSIVHVCKQRRLWPEPSLVAYAISTILSWAGAFIHGFIFQSISMNQKICFQLQMQNLQQLDTLYIRHCSNSHAPNSYKFCLNASFNNLSRGIKMVIMVRA